MEKYILVEWPESQYFMGIPGVFCSTDTDPAVHFVPESIYKSLEIG